MGKDEAELPGLMLCRVVLSRGNVEKEENSGDRVEGLPQQEVSGAPHSWEQLPSPSQACPLLAQETLGVLPWLGKEQWARPSLFPWLSQFAVSRAQ